MSRIDDLIAEFCPDGVKYKALSEIGEFYGGLTGKSKEDFSDGNGKFITYMNVFLNIAIDTNIEQFVKVSDSEKQHTVKTGDVLFTGSSETPDECGMSSVLIQEVTEPLYLNSFCFGLRLYDSTLFLPGFSKYLFRSNELRKQITKTASGVTRFNVSKKKMERVIVPIPPLSVQQEIIRILDKFTTLETKLEAELEAELEARKKQYEYYRNDILVETDGNCKYKKIGDVCLRTKNISWSGTSNTVFKYIDLTSVDRDTHVIGETSEINSDTAPSRAQKIVSTDDIIFGTTRPTMKRFCIIPHGYDGQICSTGFCVLRVDKTKVLPKFLYYQISKSEYYNYIETVQRGSAYPAVSDIDVKNFEIPVPPLAEQERIVAILDRFDALVNDITHDLPAEIEARRKQYEYYRDKLLTFKEKVS